MKFKKWTYLIYNSRWDRVTVPIFRASARGKTIPLFKTLVSNICRNSCLYCALRKERNIERGRWDINKIVKASLKLWYETLIGGVFLSSSIDKDPDFSLTREVEIAEKLRRDGFTGYIHIRVMPGASFDNIFRAAVTSDRIGVNLEAPTQSQFDEICPDKGDFRNDILKRMEWCKRIYDYLKQSRKKFSEDFGYLRGGLDTQVIIGLGESDYETIIRTYELIKNYKITRVYYSPFEPIAGTPLENFPRCQRSREIALYQAFYLIRDYGFTIEDFNYVINDDGFLPRGNIKEVYANVRKDLYPIDIENASYYELLKVPGIGPKSAYKILEERDRGVEFKTPLDLVKIIGIHNLRRASKFLIFKGRIFS